MSKIEIKLNNIDEQKKILNNGKLNMIDVVQHLKINNIVNYHYTDKIFLFMLNESVISIKLLKFITTKKIIKFINMNIQNNECNICMHNCNLDYFGCPKCLNTVCYNCTNHIIELNELFICPMCRYTL